MEKVNLRTADLTTLTPNLMVVMCDNEKVVFYAGVNVGYITPDKIFYVKKDHYDGGKKHTVFTKQAIELVTKTFQLAGSITEERVHALEKSAQDLTDLSAALNHEKDATKIKAIVEHAALIVKEFGVDPNKKRFAEIEAKANAALNPPAVVAPVAKVPHVPHVPAAPAAKVETPAEKLAAAKKNALLQFENINSRLKAAKKKKEAKTVFAEAEELKLSFETNFGKKNSEVNKAFNAVKRSFSKI